MDHGPARSPALPESLRQAIREAEATGRAAEAQAQSAMPFRARLRARDGVRPQPTLSILTHSGPITAGPVMPVAISEVRALRRPPAPPPPRPPISPTTALVPVRQRPLTVSQPAGAGRDDNDDEVRPGFFSRLNDFSQFAFAGLAVLGLAGLSVMAAENALGSKPDTDEGDGDPMLSAAGLEPALPAASVSAAAVDLASTPAGVAATPWFDYRGTADLLKTRIAALQAEETEAARLAAAGADTSAALAIANAEAARVAAEPAPSTGAPAIIDARVRDRLAAEEAARAAAATAAIQLKADQASAAAKVESDRLAAEEAARAAALAAQQQRVADAEAQRAATAEAKRLADLEAKKLAAEAEAQRLADAEALKAAKAAEAKRLADLEAKRAADAEAARLAALETRRVAETTEARRLAAVEARRLADAEAARLAAVAVAATTAAAPAPRVWSNPPGRASLKPALRPAAPQLVASNEAAVSRPVPPSLKVSPPVVRPLTGPRPVDDFIAERAEYTAGQALDVAGLDALKLDFLALVETSADGTHHQLLTPDGRPLLIHFERTLSVDAATASVQAIGYAPSADGFVSRPYIEPVNVNVKVMCRDVAYAFPGQERGRFAACQDVDGVWTMARASMLNGIPI
ncbi:MAG: hypothetical protein KKF36_12800 [Alphaproteobacteria bacterium]|nr:hypothetical protein [Alphaproteobacteria bacterium]